MHLRQTSLTEEEDEEDEEREDPERSLVRADDDFVSLLGRCCLVAFCDGLRLRLLAGEGGKAEDTDEEEEEEKVSVDKDGEVIDRAGSVADDALPREEEEEEKEEEEGEEEEEEPETLRNPFLHSSTDADDFVATHINSSSRLRTFRLTDMAHKGIICPPKRTNHMLRTAR